MARNGSGTYSVPNTFVAGNTITAAGHNENWSDLATEVTNSVAADGQTTMTGQLKGANGTKTAPSFSFATDLDTGIYRIGANNLGISCGDTKIADITTTGAAITGTLSSSGALTTTSGGHTITAGNLVVTAGDIAVNTNKFTVANATGNTVVAGTLGVTGDVAVNTNKFTVAASTGNTVVAGTLNVTGVATLSGGVAGLIAAQSDMETGTSTTLAVPPGRQHFHQSACKAWARITWSAGVPALTEGYNFSSSVTDGGPGDVTLTFTNALSTANYCVVATPHQASGVTFFCVQVHTATTTTIRLAIGQIGAGIADPTAISIAVFGDI